MATILIPFSFSAVLALFLRIFTVSGASDLQNLETWCNRTPHPNVCLSHIRPVDPNNISLEQFEHETMVLAKEEAIKATKIISDNAHRLKRPKAKTRWKNCGKHLDAAVHDLNIAISSKPKDGKDRQHSLSKALASVAGCYKESSKGHLKAISSHVYRLIENALSVRSNHLKRPGTGSPHSASTPVDPRNIINVAKDGSGDFTTIKEALDASRKRHGEGRFLIHLKAGTYNEYVDIPFDLQNLTMLGDGIGRTIITGNKHAGADGIDTYTSATFAVAAPGFVAEGITFRNEAGRDAGQAVAARSQSDHAAYYKCSFEGYQDTLFLFPGRQFFRECDIYGSMDFIFGDSTAVFQNCNILLRKHNGTTVVITAQLRNGPYDSGFVFQNSNVVPTEELRPLNGVQVFLGRPWGKYSRTVFMKSHLEGISRQGWREMWDNDDGEFVYYAEYGNTGPGAYTGDRIKWRGVRAINQNEASAFTVERFLQGNSWLPDTGVPYDPDL